VLKFEFINLLEHCSLQTGVGRHTHSGTLTERGLQIMYRFEKSWGLGLVTGPRLLVSELEAGTIRKSPVRGDGRKS